MKKNDERSGIFVLSLNNKAKATKLENNILQNKLFSKNRLKSLSQDLDEKIDLCMKMKNYERANNILIQKHATSKGYYSKRILFLFY